jgi:hypothetical protein
VLVGVVSSAPAPLGVLIIPRIPEAWIMDGEITSDAEEQKRIFIRSLCRHLVCITGTAIELKSDQKKKVFFNISGFVVSLYGGWMLITAGHALERLDKRIKNGELEIVECSLADYFALDVDSAVGIPINYKDIKKLYLDDDSLGLDFGLILLGPHYRRLLEKNVRAIPQEAWELREKLQFDRYGVLGCPEELFDGQRCVNVRGETVIGGVRPVLMMGERTDFLPDYKPVPKFPWVGIELKDKTEIKSVIGMSGGPILGFQDQPGKPPLYTIVGVQAWWDKEKRIAYGSSLAVIIKPFEESIRAMLVERDENSSSSE